MISSRKMNSSTTTAGYIPSSVQPSYTHVEVVSALSDVVASERSESATGVSEVPSSEVQIIPASYLQSSGSHLSNSTSQTLELTGLTQVSGGRTDLSLTPPSSTFHLELPQSISLPTATQALPVLWFSSPPTRNAQGHVQIHDMLPSVSDVDMPRSSSLDLSSVVDNLNTQSQERTALPAVSTFQSLARKNSGTNMASLLPELGHGEVDLHVQPLDVLTGSMQMLQEASLVITAIDKHASDVGIYSMAPSQVPAESRELLSTLDRVTQCVHSSVITGSHKVMPHHGTHNATPLEVPKQGSDDSLDRNILEMSSNEPTDTPTAIVAMSSSPHLEQLSNMGVYPSRSDSVGSTLMADDGTSMLLDEGHHVVSVQLLSRVEEDQRIQRADAVSESSLSRRQNTRNRKSTLDSSSEQRKLEGFVERVPCYKCRLCPFISLESNGVKLHVRSVHIASDDDSEDENNGDSANSESSGNQGFVNMSSVPPPSSLSLPVLPTSGSVQHERCPPHILGQNSLAGHHTNDHVSHPELVDSGNFQKRKSVSSKSGSMDCAIKTTQPSSSLQRKESGVNDDVNCPTEGGEIRDVGGGAIGASSSESIKHENIIDGSSTAPNEEQATKSSSTVAVSKKRGRPKGSKTLGLSALRKKNPKVVNEEELGYRCQLDGCAIRFKSLDNLDYHRKCHVKEGFECPECWNTFDHWRGISVHLWRCHVIDMELYGCDQCTYKTYSISKLINMHKRIHSDERPYLCDICGKGFKTNKQLRNHKVIHMDKKRQRSLRSGECEVCRRFFSDKRMLRVHMDTVHNKLRPYLCNYCGYAASCRSTLKMHLRLHTGEKPFACDLCDYRTADHNSLRRHKMRHSGEKPYKCPFCSYACIQSSTYKTHLKNKHPGQDEGLMFSCSLCAFRTIKRENFITHMADHKKGSLVGSSSAVGPMQPAVTRQIQQQQVQGVVVTMPEEDEAMHQQDQHPQQVQVAIMTADGDVTGATTATVIQQVTPLPQIEGMLPPNMNTAHFVLTAIEEIRQRIVQGTYAVEATGAEERYPILAGQLKMSGLSGEERGEGSVDQHDHLMDDSNIALNHCHHHQQQQQQQQQQHQQQHQQQQHLQLINSHNRVSPHDVNHVIVKHLSPEHNDAALTAAVSEHTSHLQASGSHDIDQQQQQHRPQQQLSSTSNERILPHE